MFEISINPVAAVILIALFADLVLHTAADILNLKQMSTRVPEPFSGYYDADKYRASQQYLRTNTRFKWVVSGVQSAVFLVFWFGHGFAMLDEWVRSIVEMPVLRGLIYVGVLFGLKAAISLPFSVYNTFVIEEKFGFNRSTVGVFVSDTLKKMLLGVVVGGVLLLAVLLFFRYAGPNAWWYCWIAVSVFIIVMQYIVPTWIMPWFNRFEPLSPGELKSAIMEYAEKINFSLQNIYVMDGSKRSSKSNAFFTGFGRHRRIVLFDTLIENHTVRELLAVLAHEMGHYKKKHIIWMMAAGIAQTGILLYLLSLFISSPMLFDAFFMDHVSVYAGLVFFGILYAPIDFFMGIAFQMASRKNEYAADRFAVETTGDGPALATALKKLATHNLSNLTPHWLYVFLNYSHPPVLDRLSAIENTSAFPDGAGH